VGRDVAIKIVLPEYANHSEFIRCFEAEAQVIARLEHPHIVPLYDYWREPNGAYLVMRWIRGGDLRAALGAGPWALNRSARLLEQLAAALAYAHRQKIVHRDIKPANILLDEERNAYQRERDIFRQFVRAKNIPFGSIDGWKTFIMQSARSEDGRRAMKAYRNSKKIALGTEAKIRVLQDLLVRHKRDKVLIFTHENEMVYRISHGFLVPAITHETNVKERRRWLEAFNSGDVLALATSKVLNEGVNIPDASVAIILSGSGSSREHIQRLGRILRKHEDKQAILYEVVTRGTTEERISQRRTDVRQFQDAKKRGDGGLFD